MHLAPTASKRVYQQRIGRIMRTHPRKEGGDRPRLHAQVATHNERVVSLHSLLDADFTARRTRHTAPAAAFSAAPVAGSRRTWLVPVTPDVSRRLAVIQREWQRIDPMYMDEDEQRYWATIAGRQLRFDQRRRVCEEVRRGPASKAALETFLSVLGRESKPAPAMTALRTASR
jgi:superfamily II DNA or RNA helicase